MEIIKVPSSAGGLSKKGSEKGPRAIEQYLHEFYLKEDGLLPVMDIQEVSVAPDNIENTNTAIFNTIKDIDMPAIILGGDHSITYSTFRAFAKKDTGLIVFDAHLDCENNFSPPSHEDYLRVLIEESHVSKENVVVVGVRNMHTNEIEYMKKKKLKTFSMQEIAMEGIREVSHAVLSIARRFKRLYISVDIDVLDPAFAPGTGYREPGGLTTRELLFFIHQLKKLKNEKMWDLVEVNPDKDIENLTVKTAAKLVVEMC